MCTFVENTDMAAGVLSESRSHLPPTQRCDLGLQAEQRAQISLAAELEIS